VIAARICDSVTIWMAFSAAPSTRQLAAVERLLGEHGPVGLSEPAAGVDGFRATSREAADARRIALLRGSTEVTHYRDIALLAVLCADSERARALALAELGPLAVDDEASARLRQTVATFLACGESHVAAAAKLFVHQKTVAYRVRQAEALLGRKLCERRTELEAALLVHRALAGSA
jgi:DNA-binding PucR family transcriptional regulator